VEHITVIEQASDLLQHAPLTVVLPMIVIGGSWILAKISGFSWGLMGVLLAVPIGLPFLPLPLSQDLSENNPVPVILLG
jgi:hypothetical protein